MSLKTLKGLEDLINTFCEDEEGEDGMTETFDSSEEPSDGSMSTADEACMEARKQYEMARSFLAASDEEQNDRIVAAVLEVVEFLRNDSTFYYAGAATLSAAATLAF